MFGTAISPAFQVAPPSSLVIVAVTLGRCALPPVPVESHTGTTSRPVRSWMPWFGPVASTFQSYCFVNGVKTGVISTGSLQVSPSSPLRW